MRSYAVFLMQWVIWSGYTLVEWMSKHDRMIYKVILFIVFFHMALYIANRFIEPKTKTYVLTLLSLVCYVSIQFIFREFWMMSA
ncbi:hypothetical protein [Bacillus testis]|uniref:hypothetical protein n=1 Tax=Bacillus testis TaxID=1622072 RepID=UPI00067ED38F|nr:hypothetical protein [Bacillus testis]